MSASEAYGQPVKWEPAVPRLRLITLALSWAVGTASVWVAAALVGGISIEASGGGAITAAPIAVVNAVLPPLLAALRLPFALLVGFLSVLLADAAALKISNLIALSHI